MGCGGSKGSAEVKAPESASGGGDGTSSGTGNQQLLSEYVLGEVLGQGAFGVVYACAKKGTKAYDYAVKMVDKVETPVSEIKKEAEMMKELEHKNVVKFHAVYYEKCFVCIVMDKYGGGDLIEGMQLHWKTKGKIPILKVMHIVRGAVDAIHHLHTMMYVHRDVKGDNYLTDRKDITDPGCRVLMSDFGTAVKLKSPTDRLKASCGTKIYWPPEFFSLNYSFKVDIWALGVIMYGLLDGRFPFKGEQDVRSKNIKLPGNTPPKCADLVIKLLDKSEEKRLDSKQMVMHPWITEGAPAGAADIKDEPHDASWTAEGMREGGPNGNQDERRKELIERLEKAANKGGPTNATQLSVLWGSRFDVNDKRTGRSMRYEWWDAPKLEEKNVLDLKNAVTAGADVGKVDVKTVCKMLEEHGINIAKFGTGDAKTMEQFATEVHLGNAILQLDAQHHKKLVRVVDVVLLRIKHEAGGVKYLTEFSELYSDGRTRDNLARLPGTKKEPHENTKATVQRIIKDMLNMNDVQIDLDLAKKEVFEEEEESRSFPGVMTIYRKEIVEGVMVSTDPGILKKLGLKDSKEPEFNHTHDKNTKVFKWLSDAECKNKKIKLHAPQDGEDVSGLVQAPVGYTEEQLTKYLQENGVDATKFGTGGTKSLKEFSDELLKGEASLMTDADGKVVRTVDIVLLILKKQGTDSTLVEVSEKNSEGITNPLNRLPGAKRRPDENQFVAAQRILKRQLKMDENLVSLNSVDVKVIEEQKDSPSYPGLTTIYRKRIISAELLKQTNENNSA